MTIESTTALPFVGLLNAAAIFPGDRNLYFHEAKSSARYSPATFIIVYSVVEIWAELLGSFGYAAIVSPVPHPFYARLKRQVMKLTMADERGGRDADLCPNLLRILDLDLVDAQYGRELPDYIRDVYPYRGSDRHVSRFSSLSRLLKLEDGRANQAVSCLPCCPWSANSPVSSR